MIAVFATIVLGGTVLLWLSHRVYLTYAHVVAREERARLRQSSGAVRPKEHIGPRCFLLLDFAVIFVLIRVLESLAFDTSEMSELRCLFLALTHFSGIIGLWMVIESQHLAFFYRKIGQAVTSHPRRRSEDSHQLPAIWRLNLSLVFAFMFAMPLALEFSGVRVGEASRESVLALFGICFVAPQVGLIAFLSRRISPLRRRAGLD